MSRGNPPNLVQFALSRLPRSKSSALYAAYTKFEKQHGTRSTLESTVLGKRRIQYEEELSHDGRNYDVWFDYARLEEGALTELREEGATTEEEEQAINRIREVYEKAVAQVPPGNEKRFWRRYIFLWLDYALFEEIETKVSQPPITPAAHKLIFFQDYERARQIYQTAIKLVPHKIFTFAKLWLLFAKFEVRRLELPAARKILGAGIGMCPKEALFKGYIQLELDVRTNNTASARIHVADHFLRSASRVRPRSDNIRKIYGMGPYKLLRLDQVLGTGISVRRFRTDEGHLRTGYLPTVLIHARALVESLH